MELEIRNRYTNKLIISLDKADLNGASLRKADLRWADLNGASLRKADLRWADLQGANLREANLRGADLRWANLHEADLRECNVITIKGLYYEVIINNNDIRIGCQNHETKEWENFSDEEISSMGGTNELSLWKEYKEMIICLAKTCNKKVKKHEEKI